jgi:hypothetical protein
MRWAAALPAAVLAALACGLAAADDPKNNPSPGADGALVVHEWGTFSTFSGSDGKNQKFYPYDNDLPDFVHSYIPHNAKQGPEGGLISLETPVIYFYSEKPLKASVQVDFPKGTMTEWYPFAERTAKRLTWKGIKVTPKGEDGPNDEKKQSRYFAARETDAVPLSVSFYSQEQGRTTAEHEKFLFYRGVGDFALPLTVRAKGEGKFEVAWDGKAPTDDLILVQIKDGKLRFQPFKLDASTDGGRADVRVPDADASTEKLSDTVVKQLISKGLTEKEARAMVKTWSSAWFGEEGTRVLYILPDALTDELLPLKIEPKPSSLVRVLVGRHDVLTPEKEKRIDALTAVVDNVNDDAQRQSAWTEMHKLGRYTEAAWEASRARREKKR